MAATAEESTPPDMATAMVVGLVMDWFRGMPGLRIETETPNFVLLVERDWLRIVLSHPCDQKASQEWGTQVIVIPKNASD